MTDRNHDERKPDASSQPSAVQSEIESTQEPRGCPTPGACSALAVMRENAELRHDIERLTASLSAEVTESAELRAQLANVSAFNVSLGDYTKAVAAANRRAETAERLLKAEKDQSACYLANWQATEKGYNELEKRRVEAERQRDEARKDAERYRWLVNESDADSLVQISVDTNRMGVSNFPPKERVDAAIDAALKESKNGK